MIKYNTIGDDFMGYKIVNKIELNPTVTRMDIYAPDVSKHAKAGEFIILRVDEYGERIPLTIYDNNIEKGTVSIIFQIVGLTTEKLNKLNVGDEILDFVGPLGKASELIGYKKALVIGGGVGSAIAYPVAKTLKNNGSYVDVILGFRNNDIVILEEEFKSVCDNLYLYTDDGSYGKSGFVTNGLLEVINNNYDVCFVIGPIIMMKNVCKITKEYNLKTIVSMNPIMIDGTGMCGGCRLYIDGEMKFACIDGPDFDGHKVDFDEMMIRNGMYKDIEKSKREEYCNLFRGTK